MTKPPKRWVDLPWPVRVDKNSRHASGLVTGEEYIPPTYDYSSKNIMGRMASGDDGIEHIKSTAGQVIPGSPVSRRSDWNIVPDPSSDGGFRLVESSFGDINPAQIPQQGSSSNIIYGNGGIYQENKGNNSGESSKVAGTEVTSGAADISGVSSALGLQWPASNVLGSGMSSAGVVSTGLSVPNSSQRPSANVLGSGMSSAVIVGTGVHIGSGGDNKLSNKGNEPTLRSDHEVSQNGQQQSHSISVESGNVGTPSSLSSKTGWKVSAPVQLQSQFLPAAHWHVGLSQKLPAAIPADSQYLSSPYPRSPASAV